MKKKWCPSRKSRNSSATACTASSRIRFFFLPLRVFTFSLLNLMYTKFPGNRHSFAKPFFTSSLYPSALNLSRTLFIQCVNTFSFSSSNSSSAR